MQIAILAIADQYQGQGIGRKLTAQSLKLAKDLGFRVARMDCTSDFSSKVAAKNKMWTCWSVSYSQFIDSLNKLPIVKPEYPHTHVRVHAIKL